MWNLKRGNAFFDSVSLKQLQQKYSEEKNMKAKLRLLVAIRRKKGESIDAIADAIEKHRRTVHGWLQRFEQRGLTGAYDQKQPGRVAKITVSQLKKLRRELIKGPAHVPSKMWTVHLVRDHIKSKYGVLYKRHNIFRLLRKLGFSVQKPRQKHYKASVTAQANFKKKQNESLSTIVYVDGRSRVWTNAVSLSSHISSEAGH